MLSELAETNAGMRFGKTKLESARLLNIWRLSIALGLCYDGGLIESILKTMRPNCCY